MATLLLSPALHVNVLRGTVGKAVYFNVTSGTYSYHRDLSGNYVEISLASSEVQQPGRELSRL
jgi:hypothetical protein